MDAKDKYRSFKELLSHESEGRDYRIYRKVSKSNVLIIAPHGSRIEPGTSEIVNALCGEDFSLYCFEGLKRRGNQALHITSTHFDEVSCLKLAKSSRTILSIHGCRGQDEMVFIGGLDEELKARLIESIKGAGFRIRSARNRLIGRETLNICNRGKSGKGIQLEITEGLRLKMFGGLNSKGKETSTPLFDRFICSIKDVLIQSIQINIIRQ